MERSKIGGYVTHCETSSLHIDVEINTNFLLIDSSHCSHLQSYVRRKYAVRSELEFAGGPTGWAGPFRAAPLPIS